VTIAYETRGDGPAVLLVHEGVADRRMWRGQVPVLARDHRDLAAPHPPVGDALVHEQDRRPRPGHLVRDRHWSARMA